MKRAATVLLSFSIVIIFALKLDAQDTASANWSLQSDQSFITSGSISAFDQTINGLTPAYEIPASGTTNKVQKSKPDASSSSASGTGSWPADTNINSARYLQFSISPQLHNNFTASSISLLLGAKGVSTLNASLYYSTDSTFGTKTFIGESDSLKSNMVTDLSYNFSATANDGKTLYIRIYPWSKVQITSTTKYLYVGNVVISGMTESLPVPALAAWFLTDSQSATLTGSVIASDQSFSNLGSYSYTQLGGETCDRIITLPTSSGTWPAETSPNFTRYIQYAVAPKTGGTFYADSIAFRLGAQFTKNLRAAVYYSQDTSFANATMLVDTALNSSNLVPFNYSISADTVKTGSYLYVRIYPYDTKAEGFAKLICVDTVLVGGTTTGVSASLPIISTIAPTYISTTFATSGGNITSDGGATVTARGVCWDTSSVPTTANSKTIDGIGTGSFVSHITGLIAGKTYYVRAYASNLAGTVYDTTIISFTTLDSVVVPTVTTTTVTNILNKSAQTGGDVTAWGGDTVKARGICWNTTGVPTIANSILVNGNDIGSFTSNMNNLTPQTTYYVRAFATNSAGTGYGIIDTFMTQATAPSITKIVAQDGSGDYTSVDSAFNAVPDNYTGVYTIYVKNGTYKEKCLLPSTKENVVLKGESRDSTIITYDDFSGRIVNGVTLGTSTSYSVDIDASDFTAENITFQNTSQAAQAVALESNGDRQSFYNCNFLGFQDTYYARGSSGPGRIYMKDCLVEGSVDFVFGRDIIVFDSCIIHENRNGGTLTAANTDANSSFGYVYLNCTITADSIGFDGNPITKFDLGRPWQAAPQTVFINCYEPATLDTAGWLAWNVTPALYAEYNCYGPGYQPTKRVSWSSQLTPTQAATYTIENIFSKNSNPAFSYDWMPVTTITGIKETLSNQLPTSYSVSQNYPNPFNPTTIIDYSLPISSNVKIYIYNTLGQLISKLVDGYQQAGYHKVEFNAANLSSGVYFYRFDVNNNVMIKKMVLLK